MLRHVESARRRGHLCPSFSFRFSFQTLRRAVENSTAFTRSKNETPANFSFHVAGKRAATIHRTALLSAVSRFEKIFSDHGEICPKNKTTQSKTNFSNRLAKGRFLETTMFPPIFHLPDILRTPPIPRRLPGAPIIIMRILRLLCR